MRHLDQEIEGGRSEFAHRVDGLLDPSGRSCAAPHDTAHFLHVKMLGERRCGRHHQKSEKPADLFRRFHNKFTILLHDGGGLFQGPEGHASMHHVHGVQSEQERGDHAEIPSPAAHCPQQILIFLRACGEEPAIGQHHVHRQQIVDGEAVLACQMTDSAAERQSGHAGG